jgi:broad specificity phosphatase PhoE
MAAQIHLVRHAEAVHNATKDKNIVDPPLTEYGVQQSLLLRQTFPHHDKVGVVLTSPLRRGIQTALGGFGHLAEQGIPLTIYPDIQPRNSKNSDYGTDREVLETEFPALDFSVLNNVWPKRDGIYADEEPAIQESGKRIRKHLAELIQQSEGKEKRDIVLVTHGIVGHFLTGKRGIPWDRAGWLSFTVKKDDQGLYHLEPTEESRERIESAGPPHKPHIA